MPRRKNQSCSELQHYNTQLRRKRTLFPCPRPHCDQRLLSKDFQNHCARVHDFNPQLGCVWCWGERSWASGLKHRQVDHMTRCWQDFLVRHAPPAPPEPAPLSIDPVRPDPVLMDLTPLCSPRDLFGHAILDVERLYDPLWPVSLRPNALTFADDGLTLAAACVRLYHELRDTMDFYHAMVRVVAFPSFLRALDEDEGRSRTLPFSTLCDGGRWPEARHRQHRHLIVVSPPGHFERHVWSKIRIPAEDRPRANYKCLKKFPIRSPLHFINTLGYLSQRESRCDFSQDECDENPVRPSSLHHFYIFTALPRDFRLPLFTQYDNGILDLLRYTYPHFSIDEMLRFPLVYLHHKWHLKIKDLPGLPLGLVVPVSRDLRPCSYPTPAYLCLVNGRQMYFKRDAEPDPRLEQQVGHLLYQAVGEELFELRPYHQLLLNQCKPLQLRNEALLAENTRLVAENAKLATENATQATDLTELRRRSARYRRSAQSQVRSLKGQVQAVQRKADRWKNTADFWKGKASLYRRKNGALQTKITRMIEAENERLREENDQLREELARERSRRIS